MADGYVQDHAVDYAKHATYRVAQAMATGDYNLTVLLDNMNVGLGFFGFNITRVTQHLDFLLL